LKILSKCESRGVSRGVWGSAAVRGLGAACRVMCRQHGTPYACPSHVVVGAARRRLHPGSPCQDARTGAEHLMLDTH